MHIISRKKLKEFWETHKISKEPLTAWYKIVHKTNYGNFSKLRETFPTADKVGKYIVFNIGGNKFRLVTVIHFERAKVYIREVLTHKQYDEEGWKNG